MSELETKEGGPVALSLTNRVVATALAAGPAYNTGALTWPVGRRGGRSPTRAERRALKSRRRRWLRKHGRAHADLAAIGAIIENCRRGRLTNRCGHPACPECADALQRLFVDATSCFIRSQPGQAWMRVSIILPGLDPGEQPDFVTVSEFAQTILREAGVTLGVFVIDASWNEDHRQEGGEAGRFARHTCLHLYGLIPAAGSLAVRTALKRLIPATEAAPRPVHTKPWDGSPAAIAYALKGEFQRRQTIERLDTKRGRLVRDTRDRPLTVAQQIQAVRALDRAGLTGRIVLVGLRFELSETGRLCLVPTT
ncbi:hypothetical protein FV242_26820 [Methylobacterium sp. WL64]|uniref:hypothetical protein n=1 Tax=Methylobacterium sp. WL64 TaxID=2603894 RepID=UPI0011C7E965|nr:hypothetical protein [Methylobacterium sp. WL64]TXM99070.1 hypothetical protein FV242_26820 [Methylobacterium sp. WL64]